MKPENPVYRIIIIRAAQASGLGLLMHWLFGWPLTGPHALGLFLIPLLCLYFLFAFVAPWSWGLPIRTRLSTQEKAIALTFDDGPSETTPRVLDVLRLHGMKATFFVLGEAVERHPDALRRIVAEGHAVGIHGYRHRPFPLMRCREIEEEIERTRSSLSRACSEAPFPDWLRPPHGFKSLRTLWAAHRSGCRLVTWSVDGQDYRALTAGRVAWNVLSHLRPGAIVLLHDGKENAATVAALALILPEMQARGYCSISLPGKSISGGHPQG